MILQNSYQISLVNEDMDEGFSSDAQRKAAFASGYKEKDKKESKTATGEKPTKVELDPKVK